MGLLYNVEDADGRSSRNTSQILPISEEELMIPSVLDIRPLRFKI